MQVTEQQAYGLEIVKSGAHLVGDAGAGCGKTTFVKMATQALPSTRFTILYFNRKNADEAKAKLPRNAKPSTVHSLAYGQTVIKNDWMQRRMKESARMPGWKVAQILGIKDSLSVKDGVSIKPNQLARLVMDTVVRYCQSDQDEVMHWHVPVLDGAEEIMDTLRNAVVEQARGAWKDIVTPKGKLPFTHDHYLKMWALGRPIIKADTIGLDEAQDTNPVVSRVVTDQAAHGAQLMLVGDRCQAIYEWRGAKDAMSNFSLPHERVVLSKSFRFGPAVADEANKWLGLLNAPLQLEGFDGIDSQVLEPNTLEKPDAVLCRTNAGCIAEALVAQQQDKKVAIAGGTAQIERFCSAARDIMSGKQTRHPDLMAFDTWSAVADYAENDSGGSDLKVLVKLINSYGVDTVEDVAKKAVPDSDADLTVSTAHRSKGLEWNKVLIGSDFREPEDNILPSAGEMRLNYVAVTRAQYVLDPGGLAWVDRFTKTVI